MAVTLKIKETFFVAKLADIHYPYLSKRLFSSALKIHLSDIFRSVIAIKPFVLSL